MVYFSSPQSKLTLIYNTYILDTVFLYIISKWDCSEFICAPRASPRFLMLWKEEMHRGLSNFGNEFQLNS